MNLFRFKTIKTVAEHQSLKLAAQTLGVSTPAVHQAIKKVEAEFEMTLFYRSGKKYIPTENCQKITQLYLGFKQRLNAIIDSQSSNKKFIGVIKCGLPLNFSKTIFPKVISNFLKIYPHTKFEIKTNETSKLINKIERFEIDFAIIDGKDIHQQDSKLNSEVIWSEELVCISKTKKTQLDFKKITQLNHIIYSDKGLLFNRWYKKQFGKAPKSVEHHIVDNVETVLSLIRKNVGIGVVPLSLVQKEIKQKKLHVININKKSIYNELLLIQNLDFIPSALIKEFLHFLKEQKFEDEVIKNV